MWLLQRVRANRHVSRRRRIASDVSRSVKQHDDAQARSSTNAASQTNVLGDMTSQ